ncbi:crotonase/enoyl-CoA hydratase family protein [Albimonas sp. CAU 1670]|uniref:crotonase/enoyl-CoA hydratase family protein n=1 Tax=Albimonas sp. CAU 1670 TaxID=3032599 RepID=UPI0023DC221F|nr:crotonase/enoyl-CoA hydratase family protein [Albimonas sp. CAU 1670]MDF2233964.1 crotonase/enoyl-CoA hydratase family protein [Albimonas sp. CAU 1670]
MVERKDYSTIFTTLDEGIFTIHLNRPDKLNAFTRDMMNEMIEAFDVSDADDRVRVVIVTGEGRGFCAGADLERGKGDGAKVFTTGDFIKKNPDGTNDYSAEELRDGGGRVTLRIFDSLKPVIGAINGPAVGIGATMQLPMDVRMVSTKARVGFVFPKRGIVPEACSSWFLPRVVGISRAVEWVTTGRIFDADEALATGFARSKHEPEDLLPAARALAKEMSENTSPVAVALARNMMWKMLGEPHPMMAHRVDSRGIASRGMSADVKEGVQSFLEKRAPNFPDKVSTDMPDYFPFWETPEYR